MYPLNPDANLPLDALSMYPNSAYGLGIHSDRFFEKIKFDMLFNALFVNLVSDDPDRKKLNRIKGWSKFRSLSPLLNQDNDGQH